jgi:hypothetical protein
MIPDVSQNKLLQAMEEYDTSIRDAPEWANWESKDTYKYAIVHDDKRYPVKQIIRMATDATDFSGGKKLTTTSPRGDFPSFRLRTHALSKTVWAFGTS